MTRWGDITARARQIARREREVYQQRELPDLLEEMAAEVERLRVELEQARAAKAFWQGVAERREAERDDLAARLQAIQQTERKYTAAKLTEAARMRKGEAI